MYQLVPQSLDSMQNRLIIDSDVKDETFPSALRLIDVSLSWGLLGVAIQTLACWGESK